jgi:hypothetical protein
MLRVGSATREIADKDYSREVLHGCNGPNRGQWTYNAHSADLASPRGVGLPSAGEQHDPGSVAFRQFLIARVEDGVHCFSQSDVRGIIGGEVVP